MTGSHYTIDSRPAFWVIWNNGDKSGPYETEAEAHDGVNAPPCPRCGERDGHNEALYAARDRILRDAGANA